MDELGFSFPDEARTYRPLKRLGVSCCTPNYRRRVAPASRDAEPTLLPRAQPLKHRIATPGSRLRTGPHSSWCCPGSTPTRLCPAALLLAWPRIAPKQGRTQ